MANFRNTIDQLQESSGSIRNILGTVLDELERRDLNTALITLCVGAGMGTATIIERV